jgi:hypothetical protein
MKGLFTLMSASAAVALAENPPIQSCEWALCEIQDTLTFLDLNEDDGDGSRAKLQNLAILRAQCDRYAEYLLPKLTPGDVQFCLMEAAE